MIETQESSNLVVYFRVRLILPLWTRTICIAIATSPLGHVSSYLYSKHIEWPHLQGSRGKKQRYGSAATEREMKVNTSYLHVVRTASKRCVNI